MRTMFLAKSLITRQRRNFVGFASFVLLTACAFAQNQTATLPEDSPTSTAPTQPGMLSDTSALTTGNVIALRSAVPSFIANAPELSSVVGNTEQMEQYVSANPNSQYTPWLHNSLASSYRHAGRITLALSHWKTVWQQLKNATDTESQNEANHALAGQAELLTTLGRVGELHDLLQSAEGRSISNREDREHLEKAREGYVMMLRNPELNFRCGTLALAEIARMQGKPTSTIDALIQEPSPKEGISLLRLVQLSRQYGLGLVAVKRTDNTPLPTPCIVHWAQNHYGALLEYRADLGSYRAIFGDPKWISAPDVDAEASGYFLIPENQRPASWPTVSDSECSQVLGKSFIYTIDDSKDKGCKVDPTNPNSKCPDCPDAKGMPAWWVTEPYVNVWLADEPVDYTTSRGEDFSFRVTVKQRDDTGNLYAYPRPGLLHNWYSRIYIQGMPTTLPQYVTNSSTHVVTTNYVGVPETNAFASWTATVDLPTGGQVTYNSSSNWSSSYDEETKTTLQPAYGKLSDGTQYVVPGYPLGGTLAAPDSGTFAQGNSSEELYGYWSDGAGGFRVVHSDGSVDRFGITYWRTNTSAGFFEEEALLTQHTDPIGNDVNLTYEFYTNLTSHVIYFRLKQVVDYDGKTNKYNYFSGNPGVLQQIVTPYNQTATFAYDSSGNLTNITDAVTNSSGIGWDANGRVSALNTPYGTTSFNYYDADLPGTNDSTLNGDITVNRSVTVADPNGGTNIYAYCFNSQTGAGTPSQFDSSVIPQSTPLGTLDTGTNEVGHDYVAVCFRNSFHWDTRESASLSTLNVGSMTSTDFAKARMQHWLGDSNNVYQTSLLSVEQDPSPDGTTAGQLTFYDYYGKTLKYLQGTNSQVAVIAHRQPSGQTDYDWKQYNSAGYVTKDISTYALASGTVQTRTNTFIYATNTVSFVLSNSMVGLPVFGPYLLNDGGYFINSYTVQQPTTPLFAVYESTSNTCGAWSLVGLGTATVALPNLLTASIDASGATNQYSGYTQVTKTTTTHTYTAWYNLYGCYCGSYLTESEPWNQYVTKTYTVPLPTSIKNPLGYTTTLTYDGSNRVSSVQSPAGLTTTNIYDSTGFLAKTIDLQIGRTNSYAHTNGLVSTWTNERGLATTYAWDKLNRLVLQSDQEGYVSNIYARLDLTATRDKLGNWTYFGYDPLQHLIATTNANQEVTLASYCSCGALEWQRDPMGNFTYYNYDLAGRVTSVNYPDGYTVNNTYNSLNELVKTSDALGYVTNQFNLQGLIVSSANSVGIIRSNSYDILNRSIAVTDARGITTLLSYDTIGRLLTNVVAGIATNSFVYAASGLIQSVDGLRTNITRFQNDVLGRVLLRTNANSEVTQFQYDPSSNITNLIDGKSQKTTFRFDAFNRLTNKLDNTSASVLQITYDANSQIKTRWTPQKGAETFVRDPEGRVRTNSFVSNPPLIFSYNPDGQLTNMIDGLGSTYFTYTTAGQPLTEGGLWANDTVSRTYNNRLRASLSVASYSASYSFDAAHRLQTIASSTGTFGYSYHSGFGGSYSSPLVTMLTLPNGMAVTNGYDIGGRLTATMMLNSSAAIVDAQQYVFNADNWRTSATRYDGSSINFGYDHIGQLKSANAKESGGANRLNEQFGYAYDAAGNLNVRTNNTLTETFAVNSINQLSTATRAGALTAAGNTAQTATSVSVNSQSAATYGDNTFATSAGLSLANGANTFTTVVQYASATLTNTTTSQLPTPVAFLYDANGNLTNDGLRSLTFDDENQLVEVSIAGQAKSDFYYDGLGRRRILQDYVWTGAWTLTNEVHYIYDGDLVIQERDANNNVLVTYDRGLDLSGSLRGAGGIGGLLARTDIKGTIYYHSDGIGNVTTLFDKYQTLEGRYLYDPYGNIVGKWGAYADVNLYRFSSKEFHPLGLYYYGGRYYDPNLQRFVNQDPLGIASGPNPYEFVLNNPLIYFDPNGLYTFGEWASIAGAGVGGLGQGAENVGNAAYNLVAGPAALAGTLSTPYGRQQTANAVAAAAALAKKYANDPCFREKMDKLLGDKAKDILTDPDKLSKLLANLGVSGLTLGAGSLAGGGADADAALAELESMSPEAVEEAASAAEAIPAAAPAANNALQLAGAAQQTLAQTQNGVLLGTIENGEVNLFQATAGGIEGHSDLLSQGLASENAQGFSLVIQDGDVAAFRTGSALNSSANGFNLSEENIQQIQQIFNIGNDKVIRN
jgi:RHS repeat-associated protein